MTTESVNSPVDHCLIVSGPMSWVLPVSQGVTEKVVSNDINMGPQWVVSVGQVKAIWSEKGLPLPGPMQSPPILRSQAPPLRSQMS